MEERYSSSNFIQTIKKRIYEINKKINAGEATTKDYCSLLLDYSVLKIKDDPEFSDAELEKYEQMAIQSAEKDIYNGFDTAMANYYLSFIYNQKYDYANALFYINRAIDIDPKNIEFYFMRASIYKACNMKKEAKIDYETAKKISPVRYNIYMRKLKKINVGSRFEIQLNICCIIIILVILFCIFLFIKDIQNFLIIIKDIQNFLISIKQ